MPNVGFKGTFLGKPLFVASDLTTTTAELRLHLARFHLASLLRLIGEINASIGNRVHQLEGVLVSRHALAYLAVAAIESSSDDRDVLPTAADVAHAVRIFNGLTEPTPASDTDGVLEHLVRLGHAQFAGHDDLHNLIARTWMLYDRIWPTVTEAGAFDVHASIRAETGLSLQQLMPFGLAYSARSKAGNWIPYSPESLAQLPSVLGIGESEHERFLGWVTATYDEIRKMGELARDSDYARYMLSPFLVKPVVRPDRPPAPGAEQVRIVPVPHYLALRVTHGLYHALATANDRGGGVNPFRIAFGHVFERYVGELLRAGSGAVTVLPEREYGPRNARKKSPDWFVIDGGSLVVVEVKQSALTLNTKTFGDLEKLADDLRKTLTKGVRQLLAFRSELKVPCVGLEDLTGFDNVQLLLVTHDEVAWANWLIRDTIAKDIPEARDVHLCSIGDLENLQRYCWGSSPYELLASKASSDAAFHDFREWLSTRGKPAGGHPLLKTIVDELLSTWRATPVDR